MVHCSIVGVIPALSRADVYADRICNVKALCAARLVTQKGNIEFGSSLTKRKGKSTVCRHAAQEDNCIVIVRPNLTMYIMCVTSNVDKLHLHTSGPLSQDYYEHYV